jgi:hypothetical protein
MLFKKALKCKNVLKLGVLLSITAILNLTKSFFTLSPVTPSLLYTGSALIKSKGPTGPVFIPLPKYVTPSV